MSDPATSSSDHPILGRITRLWWISLLRGVMMAILGAYALFRPGMTVATFAQVFGFFLAFDGILAIVAGMTGQTPSRGWMIARGIFCLLAGGFIFANPVFVTVFTAVTFVLVLAISSIASGVIEIASVIRDRKETEGGGWFVLGGAISILFGIVLLVRPLTSAALFVQMIGIFAVIGGIASILFAFRLKALGKKLDEHDAYSSGRGDAE